jgi:signal transduction histidine kinase
VKMAVRRALIVSRTSRWRAVSRPLEAAGAPSSSSRPASTPDSFDELGRLLERYVRDQARFRAAPTMRCTVEGRFDAPLDPFRALHLFRIAQEGLQNALRHAGAGHVVVRLHGHETHLAVEVEDDGVFRPPDGTGHGLAAMQARAEEIGAALHLDGTPQGTTVRVRWPGEILRTVDVHADAAAVP